jgi:mRNA-degrading endonuclease HigB of HigAB toxin-antitoxin module
MALPFFCHGLAKDVCAHLRFGVHFRASFVGKNRVVFNIKGNSYRLMVAVAYRYQAVYIKFIGTHSEYDKVDAATVEDL